MASAIGLGGLGTLCGGSMCGEAACCLGPAAIGCCCGNRCGTCNNSTSTRVVYAALLLATCISAWVMLDEKVAADLKVMSKYSGEACEGLDNAACAHAWGTLGVFRVMFGTSLFFGILACLMVGVKSSSDKRAGIQNGYWGPKLMVLIGIIVGAFFMPNDFFVKYFGVVGIIGAFVFMIIQMILLVDFAHGWAESWIEKMENGSSGHKWGLIICGGGMYVLSFIATVLMYVYYTKSDTEPCTLNKTFISLNMIFAVIMTAIALSERVREVVPNSGLIQSGVMIFYTTYLTWSAMTGEPNSTCQPGTMDENDTLTTVLGAMLTFLSVCYASLRTTSASQLGKLGMGDEAAAENAALLTSDDLNTSDDGGESGGRKTVDNERDAVLYNWCMFHLTFMFASLYMMMILTDWAVIKDDHQATIQVGRGDSSVWSKIISGWICSLLYIWSLVAPLCLPNRSFD